MTSVIYDVIHKDYWRTDDVLYISVVGRTRKKKQIFDCRLCNVHGVFVDHVESKLHKQKYKIMVENQPALLVHESASLKTLKCFILNHF